MTSPFNSEIDPSYNDLTVVESGELATALDQYWQTRKAACRERVERLKQLAANPEAEPKWQAFCSYRIGFLERFQKVSVKASGGLLLELWNRDASLVHAAQRALQGEIRVELCIPYQRLPLKFACASPGSGRYKVRESTFPTGQEYFELGKAYVTVFLGETCLFTIVPSGNYVTLNTFEFVKDDVVWSSGETLPKVFARALVEFQADLRGAEREFAPLCAVWDATAQVAQEIAKLDRFDQSAREWKKVQIPETQKLDLLRRMELFEAGDPAAPRGLLLQGPPGTGKSLIARTLAKTCSCDFQKLSLADIKERDLGASGQRVREIWNHARSHRSAIIFIDECDGVFGRRGAAETDIIAADIVRAFLPEWDGIEQTPGIMVICATNRRDMLDDAILQRFGWEIEVSLPGASDRRNILQQEVQALGIETQVPEEMVPLTQGMSGRDLRSIVLAARSLAYPGTPGNEHFLAATSTERKRANVHVDQTAKWETLALGTGNLDRLKLICTLLHDTEKWETQGIAVPKSLLLIGPDAGGKRRAAHALGNESGLAFFSPTMADLKANFSGQSGNRVKMIFERACSSSPSILFLDRLDLIAPSRASVNASDPLTNEIVGQLAQECERLRGSASHVFLLGASSSPDQIDAEILSCFDERMLILLPNLDARMKLLTGLLTGKRVNFPLDDGALLLAQLTEHKGLATNDLETWVQSAERKALLRALQNGGPEHYSISLDDFDAPEGAIMGRGGVL